MLKIESGSVVLLRRGRSRFRLSAAACSARSAGSCSAAGPARSTAAAANSTAGTTGAAAGSAAGTTRTTAAGSAGTAAAGTAKTAGSATGSAAATAAIRRSRGRVGVEGFKVEGLAHHLIERLPLPGIEHPADLLERGGAEFVGLLVDLLEHRGALRRGGRGDRVDVSLAAGTAAARTAGTTAAGTGVIAAATAATAGTAAAGTAPHATHQFAALGPTAR